MISRRHVVALFFARRSDLRRLGQDTRGSILPLFAVLLTLGLSVAGLAIDGAYYLDSKRLFDTALDQAALAATSDVRRAIMANPTSSTAAVTAAKATARKLFELTANRRGNVTVTAFDPDLTYANQTVTATFTYTAMFTPFILRVVGRDSVTFKGRVTSKSNVLPYMEITFLIDTSGSMGIGVDLAAQNTLRDAIGCSFACHDGVKFGGYADTYAYAQAKGITLRFDAINAALSNLIDRFDTYDPNGTFIKAQIWSFDTITRRDVGLTYNRWRLKRALPSAPSMSGVTDGATNFNDGIWPAIGSIGVGGDGSSPSSPIKLVILATDGVEDPGRQWVSNLGLRTLVDVFDLRFCEVLKDADIRIGIVHTPYVPMTWDWGYMATLGMPSQKGGRGTRADDIEPTLRSCAAENYHKADDQAGITSGFTNIFSNIVSPRLTQ